MFIIINNSIRKSHNHQLIIDLRFCQNSSKFNNIFIILKNIFCSIYLNKTSSLYLVNLLCLICLIFWISKFLYFTWLIFISISDSLKFFFSFFFSIFFLQFLFFREFSVSLPTAKDSTHQNAKKDDDESTHSLHLKLVICNRLNKSLITLILSGMLFNIFLPGIIQLLEAQAIFQSSFDALLVSLFCDSFSRVYEQVCQSFFNYEWSHNINENLLSFCSWHSSEWFPWIPFNGA